MKSLRVLSTVCALAITACSGGGGSASVNGATQLPPAHMDLAPTMFVFTPAKQSSAKRRPTYVTANVASVTIALNTVNGGSPPSGLTTSVTTNITLSACPCSVPGPSVPPGSDGFTLTTYDATGGTGNVVSTATATYTINVGQTNNNAITLNGVPASFTLAGIPSGTAGTAFGSAQSFTVTAKDADGNAILGTYASAVSLTDSDATGATTIATSGSDSPPAGTLVSSSDGATLNYSGLAIAPAIITASATGATNGTATFTPALQPIVWTCTQSGGCSANANEVDLYATSGTGSAFTWTATEVGWTNAPYNKSIIATPASGCSSIASVSGGPTSFTSAAASTPSAGTCTLTLSDFTGGQTKPITQTYTTSGFGVQ